MNNLLKKTYDIEFKSLGDGKPGEFEAIVSVFGNVDLLGDRVMPGAFTKSIQRLQATGNPVPVVWTHDWADPFATIGAIDPFSMEEVSKGLKVKGTIDLSNPFAAQVHSLMKQRLVREWSFSFPIATARTRKAADGANDILEADIVEIGPCIKGVNENTETLQVKGLLERAAHPTDMEFVQKAGRVLSTKNETKLREALASITDVLATLGEVNDSATNVEAKSKEPEGANDEELLRFKAELEALQLPV
jgi:hypothetical protein